MVCKYYLSIQTLWTSLCPHCLFVLRKELKFILATHTDGRGWTRRGGAPAYNQVGRGGGAVRPSRPIAKSATGLYSITENQYARNMSLDGVMSQKMQLGRCWC